MTRRRIRLIVLAVTASVLLLFLAIAPAQAGRVVKGGFHALPGGFKDLIPDNWEQGAGETVDGFTQFFAAGDPDRLADFDIRLEAASIPPGGWGPRAELELAWKDLHEDLDYEVSVRTPTGDVQVARVQGPTATFDLPGDGEWLVTVRPLAGGKPGHATELGPFRVDSSPPPAPTLQPIEPPESFTFVLAWTPVEDTSGILGYQVERVREGGEYQAVAFVETTQYLEEQVGNGRYHYRVRAVNGAGLLGIASNAQPVEVTFPMQNPGRGSYDYGIHANYTSVMRLWDLSDPSRYATTDEVPPAIASEYLQAGWGFETGNETLQEVARSVVGTENNTLLVAQRLFRWLFDHADYDQAKREAGSQGASGLQRAGETFDRKLGICGDLATLYITMLRISGVPARPVHGYLDNPRAGIGDFHVWVEAWVGASVAAGAGAPYDEDWMTIDVSGITGPYSDDDLMIYFGVFNPEYLSLGMDADYSSASWNSWARFSWSQEPGDKPTFEASGRPQDVAAKTADLYYNAQTKERVLVPAGGKAPSHMRYFYRDVTVQATKRLDYGVELGGDTPVSATIRLRHPDADRFGALSPWQSVIYTIYTTSTTTDKDPATGKSHTLAPYGFAEWRDDFR